MCVANVDHTVFVGPHGSLRGLAERWRDVPTVRGAEISDLDVVDLSRGGHHLADPDSAAVAVAHHAPDQAHLAYRIQSDLLLGAGAAPGVMCSPGIVLAPAGGGGGAGAPTVALTPRTWSSPAATAAHVLAGSPDVVAGHRVLVIDTGDANSANDMWRVRGNVLGRVAPDDADGHGTAVCGIIREVRGDADVHVFSALDDDGAITGVTVLAGLAYAFQADTEFDIVNVSLTANHGGGCATTLGAVMDHLANLVRNRPRTTRVPLVVAAAGNEPAKDIAYPARMKGAIVALATDRRGDAADYNSRCPAGTRTESAFGGEPGDAFGTITRPGQPAEDVYGTSFAAPLITAGLLP